MTPQTHTLGDIEGLTKNLAQARDLLTSRVRQLRDEHEASNRRAEPLIKSAVSTVKAAEDELRIAIESNRSLFKRPKSRIFHGLQVGIEKSKGKIKILNPEATIDLIKTHLKARFNLLVKTKRTVSKPALRSLSADELKRIGVEVGVPGDVVFVRSVDSDVEKALKALLSADSKVESEVEADDGEGE